MKVTMDASRKRISVSEHGDGFHVGMHQLMPAQGLSASIAVAVTIDGEHEIVLELNDAQAALLGRSIDAWAQSVIGPRGVWETALNESTLPAGLPRCRDCGELGQLTGHMGCQFPGYSADDSDPDPIGSTDRARG